MMKMSKLITALSTGAGSGGKRYACGPQIGRLIRLAALAGVIQVAGGEEGAAFGTPGSFNQRG